MNVIQTISTRVSNEIILPLSKAKGLGDVVATIANPVAKVADIVLNTNIAECNSCKKRQEKLNTIIPFRYRPSGPSQS
jgi:hypothetical protein